MDSIDLLTKAWRLYSEQVAAADIEPLLSFTRAWRLVKFVDADMLTMTACSKCNGKFVTEPYENSRHFLCGLCNPGARRQEQGQRRPHGPLSTSTPLPTPTPCRLAPRAVLLWLGRRCLGPAYLSRPLMLVSIGIA
jgi:hypothetical protein